MATFYGIPDVEIIWHGTNSDPEIEYKGARINYYLIEDSLWESYSNICDEAGKQPTDDDFKIWLSQNHDEAYEYLDMAIKVIRYDFVKGAIDNLRSRLDCMDCDLDDSESESDNEDKETLFQVVGDHIDDLIEDAKKLQKYIREH